MIVPIGWLEKINQEFSDAGIEHRQRSRIALSRYAKEFKTSFLLIGSPISDEIFEWFESHSKPDSHSIGSAFESVYYFDAEFWSVSVPIFYGKVQLNPLDYIEMPSTIKSSLWSKREILQDYLIFWVECVDYGRGIESIVKNKKLNQFGLELLTAGDQEFRGAVSLLKEIRPNTRAMMSCRMATEMFFKAYLVFKENITENEAKKKLGHNLDKCFDKFIESSGHKEIAKIKNKLKYFPDIPERYNKLSQDKSSVWECFRFTHFIGTFIIHEITGKSNFVRFNFHLEKN